MRAENLQQSSTRQKTPGSVSSFENIRKYVIIHQSFYRLRHHRHIFAHLRLSHRSPETGLFAELHVSYLVLSSSFSVHISP